MFYFLLQYYSLLKCTITRSLHLTRKLKVIILSQRYLFPCWITCWIEFLSNKQFQQGKSRRVLLALYINVVYNSSRNSKK